MNKPTALLHFLEWFAIAFIFYRLHLETPAYIIAGFLAFSILVMIWDTGVGYSLQKNGIAKTALLVLKYLFQKNK